MLNCILIDDEALARDVLEGYLSRLDFIGPVHQFGNAYDALLYLENHEADILFLDIEMPGMNGLDFLKILPHPPITVFTTAYRDYAFEGFELGVIDFLLKPISFPRFVQTIHKIRDFLSLKEQNARLEDNPASDLSTSIFVKSGVQRIKLTVDDVVYIQGLKDYAIIYTTTGKIVLKGSIKAMHDIFPRNQFIRVHKSFIVAVARITRIERNRLVLTGSSKDSSPIPIGRNYKEDVEKALTNLRS
ncbi:response regulator transcription factor [Spirosoma sp. KCTC 42546]|uniref:LytR/AlgR family response regulator transcription factor n=1 Tax=Spirosoma sp. KCTC 42546 TaxID=2520506 RepID=UPI00115707B8|nr:LytTR family DNA-binding domain-containing protein [Spirosoma sp. KCTC 42546]QDK81767.1 response regulator transcription factor [Spirosoma sp. KCTC 42546]